MVCVTNLQFLSECDALTLKATENFNRINQMKTINRRQFVTRLSLTTAGAVVFHKLGYTATGYYTTQIRLACL
jgi:hypothetical protein